MFGSRLAAILTAAAVLVPLSPGAASAGEVQVRSTLSACPQEQVTPSADNGYDDLAGNPFEREVNCLSDYGIAHGRSPGRFDPGAPVLRRQMALFLSRVGALAGMSPPSNTIAFSDLGGVDPATREAIDFVTGYYIARGKGDGRFAPDEPVTRGQMATFLSLLHSNISAGGGFEPEGDVFDDIDESPHRWAIEDVAGAGVARGVAPRTYAPDRHVTRAQMAGFLARMIDIQVAGRDVPWRYASADQPAPPVYTSTGLRCTIAGTNHSEVLTGTAGDDVICGLEGEDTIDGLGGNDVLDSGPTGGVMRGGDGDDLLIAHGGPDRLEGGAGNDVLYGGSNADTLLGEGGRDTLYGQEHNDDLDGGAEADVVDGGGGTNRCPPDELDEQRLCDYDDLPPVVDDMTVSPGEIDVTHQDAQVTVRFRARSNLGLREVAVQSTVVEADGTQAQGPWGTSAELVSGNMRDGIFEATAPWPHGARPAQAQLYVRAIDHAERVGAGGVDLLVRNDAPDVTAPEVRSVVVSAPGGLPVDAREGPREVTVEARLTDDLAGVYRPSTSLRAPGPDGYGHGSNGVAMTLVSGDALDGLWRGTVTIGNDAPSGDWNVVLHVPDRVDTGWDIPWLGPEHYREATADGRTDVRPLPDGAGTVPVLGPEPAPDPGEPGQIAAIDIAPREVDTRYGDQRVTVAVHVVDPDGGTRTPYAFLHPADTSGDRAFLRPTDARLVSGSPTDGWYELVFFFVQGLPPETYHLQVALADANQIRSWHGTASPYAGQDDRSLVLDDPGTVTVAWP